MVRNCSLKRKKRRSCSERRGRRGVAARAADVDELADGALSGLRRRDRARSRAWRRRPRRAPCRRRGRRRRATRRGAACPRPSRRRASGPGPSAIETPKRSTAQVSVEVAPSSRYTWRRSTSPKFKTTMSPSMAAFRRKSPSSRLDDLLIRQAPARGDRITSRRSALGWAVGIAFIGTRTVPRGGEVADSGFSRSDPPCSGRGWGRPIGRSRGRRRRDRRDPEDVTGEGETHQLRGDEGTPLPRHVIAFIFVHRAVVPDPLGHELAHGVGHAGRGGHARHTCGERGASSFRVVPHGQEARDDHRPDARGEAEDGCGVPRATSRGRRAGPWRRRRGSPCRRSSGGRGRGRPGPPGPPPAGWPRRSPWRRRRAWPPRRSHPGCRRCPAGGRRRQRPHSSMTHPEISTQRGFTSGEFCVTTHQ